LTTVFYLAVFEKTSVLLDFYGAGEDNGGRGTDNPGGCHPNRTNGTERCWLGGRKGIRPVKNFGGCGCGGAVSPVGVAPTRIVGASASIIFPCSIKIQKN